MREVIYLSEGKLRQFLPEHGRTRSWSHLGVRWPVVGVDVNVDRTAATSQQQLVALFRQVEKHLASQVVPYEMATQPGQWVKFQTPLNWFTVEQEPFGGMVLFVQPESAVVAPSDQPARRCRLLLHGSPRHLLGRPPQEAECDVSGSTSVGTTTHQSGSDQRSFAHLVRNADILGNLFEIRRLELEAGPQEISRYYFGEALRKFVGGIDERLDPETAAWAAGYARVTRFVADHSPWLNYLVATPLYVMYSAPGSLPGPQSQPSQSFDWEDRKALLRRAYPGESVA